jgi:hypothetical protein
MFLHTCTFLHPSEKSRRNMIPRVGHCCGYKAVGGEGFPALISVKGILLARASTCARELRIYLRRSAVVIDDAYHWSSAERGEMLPSIRGYSNIVKNNPRRVRDMAVHGGSWRFMRPPLDARRDITLLLRFTSQLINEQCMSRNFIRWHKHEIIHHS